MHSVAGTLVFYLSLLTQNTLQIWYSGLIAHQFGLQLLSSLNTQTNNQDVDLNVRTTYSHSPWELFCLTWIYLDLFLCIKRSSDLLLKQSVRSLKSLILHRQLTETKLCLFFQHSLNTERWQLYKHNITKMLLWLVLFSQCLCPWSRSAHTHKPLRGHRLECTAFGLCDKKWRSRPSLSSLLHHSQKTSLSPATERKRIKTKTKNKGQTEKSQEWEKQLESFIS